MERLPVQRLANAFTSGNKRTSATNLASNAEAFSFRQIREKGNGKYRKPKRYSEFQTVPMRSPNEMPHSPPQKSDLYIPGDLKKIGLRSFQLREFETREIVFELSEFPRPNNWNHRDGPVTEPGKRDLGCGNTHLLCHRYDFAYGSKTSLIH